jgi:very-short-patch-repair endonuclease
MSTEDKAAIFLYYWRTLAQGYPEPMSEYNFDKHAGRCHRFDFCFPEHSLAIEINGGNHMVKYSRKTGRYVAVGRHTQERDYEKMNLAAELGWLVLQFTPAMLEKEPSKCINQVLRIIKNKE